MVVPKRPWKETKIVISFPNDVLEALVDEAAQLYKSVAVHLRDYHIERLRRGAEPQPIETSSYPQPGGQPGDQPGGLRGVRGSRSGYKGVYAYGRRWEAVAYVNRRRHRLGVYDTAEAAARAYDTHLVAQAGGDPSAAVNFPPSTSTTPNAGPSFVEQFASTGKLSDVEWKQWQGSQAATAAPVVGPPIPVIPDGPRPDAKTPLIDRPAKQLYRRDSVPTLIAAVPAEPDMTRPDPEPAEPDADPEHVH